MLGVAPIRVKCTYCGAKPQEKCTNARSRIHEEEEARDFHGERTKAAAALPTCVCELRDRAWDPTTGACRVCGLLFVDEREGAFT